jgi:small subunit ribosomal protein S20
VANTKSAEKRNRQAQKRRARNTAVRSTLKTAVRTLKEALGAKDSGKAQEAYRKAERVIAKAASKGVLHARNASRRISRLAKQVRAQPK